MKKCLLLIVYILMSSICFAQSKEWRLINTPFKESVKLIYQSSDGLLFGSLTTFSHKLVCSFDKGQNWTMEGVWTDNGYNNSVIRFTESKNGELYYFIENKVFIFNKSKKSFDTFISLDSNFPINDMAVLHKGGIVIASYIQLILFDNLGALKNSYPWKSGIIKLLIGSEVNSKNYLVKLKDNMYLIHRIHL